MKEQELPPLNHLVKVWGTWYGGEWQAEAMRKPYKKKPKRGKSWRWVHEDGERVSDQFIHRWEEINLLKEETKWHNKQSQ